MAFRRDKIYPLEAVAASNGGVLAQLNAFPHFFHLGLASRLLKVVHAPL